MENIKCYNYREAVTDDINQYLTENHINANDADIDKLCSSDFITGNASGSYTFNRLQAERNLVGNYFLLKDAVEDLAPGFDLLKAGAEAADVLIRIYLVPIVMCDLSRQF